VASQYAADFGAPATARDAAAKRYLIGPIADFWCFGGSTLIIFPLLLMLPVAEYRSSVYFTMLSLALVVNNPHFAHSYQIFYRGFRAKAFAAEHSRAMRMRYLFAGVAAPILLALFFAAAIFGNDLRLLGYGVNAMILFVGWHYVKQGYGLLMVDCTLKRQFFAPREKKVLLANGYAVWLASWAAVNASIAREDVWGIAYYTFDLPTWAVVLPATVAAATSGAAAWMLAARWRLDRTLPVNGVIAYGASLYLWLAFAAINPLWFLVAPALHSLQYLAVVWRFQLNYEAARLARADHAPRSVLRRLAGDSAVRHTMLFGLGGTGLGLLGFWLLPIIAGTLIPYDRGLYGASLFLFVAWVFLNIHHYFIDNVIWRRENPEAKAYLFT
jgi:hypothetical protein